MFLEDADWKKAEEFLEQVLNREPENAYAYLGKLMVELQVRKQEELKYYSRPFIYSDNYIKTIRFANEELKETLDGYLQYIEEHSVEKTYQQANELIKIAETKRDCEQAIDLLRSILYYKDSVVLLAMCEERLEEIQEKNKKNNVIVDILNVSVICIVITIILMIIVFNF